MQGRQEDPGVLPISLQDLFRTMEKRENTHSYAVWVSYLEIYNEKLCDLLNPEQQNLKITDDPKVQSIQ